jgi:hypothetical protein
MNNEETLRKHLTNNKAIRSHFGTFEGKTIKTISALTPTEIDDMAWYEGGGAIPMIIEFTDGSHMIPMSDPEGNNAGWLHTYDSQAGETE